MGRSAITRAIGEVRPLLAERGCTIRRGRGCGHWLRSSTTSEPAGRSASSTEPRSASGARPPGARTELEILADAGYQGLGAQTGGRVATPPHRKFKKNVPDWYEETGGHWPATSAAASTSATRSKPLPVCCPTSQQRT
ncbi:hypothetical protein [Streptomyces sp. NPDC002343]